MPGALIEPLVSTSTAMFTGGIDSKSPRLHGYWLEQYGIDRVGVSQCTGLEKAASLRAHLGDRFFFGSVGAELEG